VRRSSPRRWRILLIGATLSLLLPLANPWLAHRSGHVVWLLDLTSHWQWFYALVLVLAACRGALQDKRALWALPLVALPWLTAFKSMDTTSAPPDLAVASANVHLDNQDVTPLRDWIAQAHPDIVVVLEVSSGYAQGLAALKSHPHQVLAPESSPFGIGLISSIPLTDTQVIRDADGIAHIEARAVVKGRQIRVMAFHPMPPLSPYFHQARRERLLQLTSHAHPSEPPTIIVGDFNASPWSSAMSGLANQGWARATGLRPTWPALGQGWMGIPIDQIIGTRHWQQVDHARGPDLASDHYPVMARLSLNAP
jgi:endonuclease/exonuclease/phosphatase (EEP) superfamily protein YafD